MPIDLNNFKNFDFQTAINAKAYEASNNKQVNYKKDVSCDSFVKTKKEDKNSKIKKGLKITLGVTGLLALSFLAVSGARRAYINKILKEKYNNIYDDIAKGIKDSLGVVMEKPKLKFKSKMEKDILASYSGDTNIVSINKKYLYRNVIASNSNTLRKLPISELFKHPIKCLKLFQSKKIRFRKTNETLIENASILRHELTHAKQMQMLLSTEGGKEKYIESISKKLDKMIKCAPKEKEEALRETCPFIFSYKPATLLKPTEMYTFGNVKLSDGRTLPIKYSLSTLINYHCNYDNSDYSKYISNLLEIEANYGETISLSKAKEYISSLPKAQQEKINNNAVEAIFNSATNNFYKFLNALSKNKHN